MAAFVANKFGKLSLLARVGQMLYQRLELDSFSINFITLLFYFADWNCRDQSSDCPRWVSQYGCGKHGIGDYCRRTCGRCGIYYFHNMCFINTQGPSKGTRKKRGIWTGRDRVIFHTFNVQPAWKAWGWETKNLTTIFFVETANGWDIWWTLCDKSKKIKKL